MSSKAKNDLAANLRLLMEERDLSQSALAQKSKGSVSQKTISNMLKADGDHHPRVDNIEAVADVLQIDSWLLLLPHSTFASIWGSDLARLINSYAKLRKDGRDHIDQVMEREFEYSSLRKPA